MTKAPAVKIAGAAALITVLTVVARLAGFGRTFVFLNTVGPTNLGDVYNAANTIPNIVFELVAGGALASLVVPLLAGAVANGDRERVDAVSSALLTWVLVLLVPLAGLVALLAGPIASLLDLPAAHQETAASMLRVFAPQLPLYGVGIVLTGVLQAHHRFAWPVIAPLLSSVTVMGAYLSYAVIDGTKTGLGGLTRTGELFLSVGTTCGVVVLALCLFIPLRRLRLRLRPSLRFPGDEGRQAVRLGWAGAVTVGSQQLITLAAIVLLTGDGDLSLYNAAQTVFLLPWAVLAVPVATAVYPSLSAAASRGDDEAYRQALSGTARSVMLLAGLGVAVLIAVAGPAAFLIAAGPASSGIVGFAPGLLGYALFALLSRALYARGATSAAAFSTAVGWVVAAGSALALTVLGDNRQVLALSLANAIGMSVIGLLLVLAVRRHAGAAALAGLGRTTLVTVLAAGLAALAGWGVVAGLGGLFGPTPQVLGSIVQGILGGLAVLVVFVGVVYPLARHDLAPLARRLRRRSA
ncbi:murein biosynthesis integral membrane protein MurJ [Paractinoplanes lichenicola]|uniref:Oligosaccharide flippase family protein n=1 Tax=Paractinoplanes lichenicola TaxID=2802976 RepID=A0ABS1W479_9ACTN|nr:lipid II flippase MurJ [Actinoplanes lichenicola]MBL7261542.1 oligosaccharide flippase family protein [Actinoplanes lichenicola]